MMGFDRTGRTQDWATFNLFGKCDQVTRLLFKFFGCVNNNKTRTWLNLRVGVANWDLSFNENSNGGDATEP